jgi:uncharacterized protein
VNAPIGPEGGRLAANVMHFARALRAAGLPVGPGRVIEALRAIETVGVASRDDLYWTLFSVFVNRRDQRLLFDQAFHIFWRDPRLLERMMQMMLPTLVMPQEEKEEVQRRLAEALAPEKRPGRGEGEAETEKVELDAVMTFSERELLQKKDFEQMSLAEVEAARRAIRKMSLDLIRVATRRFRRDPRGERVDMRATLRRSIRSGGRSIELVPKTRIRRTPPLVVLCDISGSMSRYSRMLLHFMHALTGDRERVHSFLFGTRLTNITRQLRERDVDLALAKVAESVADWSGGTRIGHCLHVFNRDWARRVLAQGAIVLLITDGLDRDAGQGLAREIERLHKSCRRLVWLNPLLRYDAYAPISSGAKVMVRHVDELRSVHNLDSLEELADVLSRPIPRREAQVRRPFASAA